VFSFLLFAMRLAVVRYLTSVNEFRYTSDE